MSGAVQSVTANRVDTAKWTMWTDPVAPGAGLIYPGYPKSTPMLPVAENMAVLAAILGTAGGVAIMALAKPPAAKLLGAGVAAGSVYFGIVHVRGGTNSGSKFKTGDHVKDTRSNVTGVVDRVIKDGASFDYGVLPDAEFWPSVGAAEFTVPESWLIALVSDFMTGQGVTVYDK